METAYGASEKNQNVDGEKPEFTDRLVTLSNGHQMYSSALEKSWITIFEKMKNDGIRCYGGSVASAKNDLDLNFLVRKFEPTSDLKDFLSRNGYVVEKIEDLGEGEEELNAIYINFR